MNGLAVGVLGGTIGQDRRKEVVADPQLVAILELLPQRSHHCRVGLPLSLALPDLFAVDVGAVETAQVLGPGRFSLQLDQAVLAGHSRVAQQP